MGAADGLINSNTAFFDRHLGWQGFCIEPDATQHAALVRNRPRCWTYRGAATNELPHGGMAPFVASMQEGRLQAAAPARSRPTSRESREVPIVHLQRLLDERGVGRLE